MRSTTAERYKKPEFKKVGACRFCEGNIQYLDYKDVKTLQRFITSYGKIEARKRSGVCARHQRLLKSAVKRARMAALLPFAVR